MKKYPLLIILIATFLLVSIPGALVSLEERNFEYPSAAVLIQTVKNGDMTRIRELMGFETQDPDEMAEAAIKAARDMQKDAGVEVVSEAASEIPSEEPTEAEPEDTEDEEESHHDEDEEDNEDEDDEEDNDEDSDEDEDEEDNDEDGDDETDENGMKEFTTVDDDYFADACLIGDSRVQGLGMYSGLPATNYGIVGISLSRVFDKKCITTPLGKLTIPEALAVGPQYGKIYLKFGLNEIGWGTNEQFAEYYYSFIDYIKAVQPDAIIYVMSILHVTEGEERKSSVFTNDRIDERNKYIKEVAEREHVYYLDVNEVFTDENGRMPSEDSFDGIHVKADAIGKWTDYLKTHAIEK
ncbi:MAG: hypothetical protein K6E90_02250 [Lachnospiraceae bacterium]|nr:hypothetical protein [Lachnospiraceae bacterium]